MSPLMDPVWAILNIQTFLMLLLPYLSWILRRFNLLKSLNSQKVSSYVALKNPVLSFFYLSLPFSPLPSIRSVLPPFSSSFYPPLFPFPPPLQIIHFLFSHASAHPLLSRSPSPPLSLFIFRFPPPSFLPLPPLLSPLLTHFLLVPSHLSLPFRAFSHRFPFSIIIAISTLFFLEHE